MLSRKVLSVSGIVMDTIVGVGVVIAVVLLVYDERGKPP